MYKRTGIRQYQAATAAAGEYVKLTAAFSFTFDGRLCDIDALIITMIYLLERERERERERGGDSRIV